MLFSEILKNELVLNGLDTKKIYNQDSNVWVKIKISKVSLENQLGDKIKKFQEQLNSK